MQRTIEVSGQPERIPTSEWRGYSKEVSFNVLGYSISYASVNVTQNEYHTTATHAALLEDRCST